MTESFYLRSVKDRVYDNCKMYDPDNVLIAYIPEKRARWYLKKNLAILLEEAPLAIKLTFIPKRSELRTGIRENICVVCGVTQNLTRHHTVPDTIRKHLPMQYKSKVSHDILAVCAACHSQYESQVNKLQLTQIPLVREAAKVSSRLQQIARYFNSLDGYLEVIPENRIKRIHERISKLLVGLPDYTYQLFPFIIGFNPSEHNLTLEQLGELQESHKAITKHLVERDITNIPEFIFSCRQQFVDLMNPQHLPEDWDIFSTKWSQDDRETN
ncbi:hypothetical protein C4588_03665 [Candidatus Parcubacteria bacterium]|nr:MAG: hypothetical protein C4588_03665 [Candidatus Parcubacteria bacterium]